MYSAMAFLYFASWSNPGINLMVHSFVVMTMSECFYFKLEIYGEKFGAMVIIVGGGKNKNGNLLLFDNWEFLICGQRIAKGYTRS